MADYDWYEAALANRNPPIHEGQPQEGFYRKPSKEGGDKVMLPTAIWMDGGVLVARVGFVNATRIIHGHELEEMWTWLAKHPVEAALYWSAYEAGGWPNDMAPTDKRFGSDGLPLPGDNRPPVEVGSIADFQERINNIMAVPTKEGLYVDGRWVAIDDQAKADKISSVRERLAEVLKEVEAGYVVAKTPSETALKAIREEWFGVSRPLEAEIASLRGKVDAYIKAENRRRAELATAAAAAALAARQAAAPPEVIEAAEAEAAVVAAPAKVLVGGAVSGRRTGARVNRTGKITDYAAFLAAMKDSPEIREAAQTVANRLARNQLPTAGMEIIED